MCKYILKDKNMKSILLNPLLAPLCVLCYVTLLFLWNINQSASDIFLFCDTVLEFTTYLSYGIGLLVALWFYKDFGRHMRLPYLLFLFLLFCAALREMGIQHWLTSTDTTAFKIRFFTNPTNPLSEKILAASILATVGGVVLYLLIRFIPSIIKGFFKFNPLYWTICTFGGTGIVCKIADRIPGNYRKATGVSMDPYLHSLFELLEESTESLLILLFALAIIQYHVLQKKFIFKK